MKKLTTIIVLLVLALTACTGQESKQRHGVPPMNTEEKEVYSAYEGASQSDASRVSASQKLADEEENVYGETWLWL